jgi:hypothetical protein
VSAAEQWARELAAWAIPEEILAQAPESPWCFPPKIFAAVAEGAVQQPASVSTRRALEALEPSGTVLDVGVGGGAACLRLVPPATSLCGVDQGADMLAAFSRLASARGIDHTTVEGVWPDVAAEVEAADVAVCHHVFYNVGPLVPFVEALTARARRRVVVELTVAHPQSALNDLWRRFWGVERPTGPDCDLALAVVREAGYDARVERWEAPGRWTQAAEPDVIAFIRRRLCLGPERDAEIAAALGDRFDLTNRQLATLWWEGTAS